MAALLEQAPIKRASRYTLPEGNLGQLFANGRWVDVDEFEADLIDDLDDAPDYAWGGIDGEEFMGTGTAFDTDEAGPVYTPAGS